MNVPSDIDPMGVAKLFPLPPLPVLPSGYTKKTWLQSNGDAYIDTERLVTAVTTWVMTWEVLTKNTFLPNGAYAGDGVFSISFTLPSSGGYLTQWWDVKDFRSYEFRDGPITMALSNYRELTSVGRLTKKMTGQIVLPTKTLILLARNETSRVNHIAGTKRVYRSTIFEADECVQDLVPCLDSAGKPCLFDGVTRRAFYSKTGTDFTTD